MRDSRRAITGANLRSILRRRPERPPMKSPAALLAAVLFLLAACVPSSRRLAPTAAEPATTVYLVRHAEKASGTAPGLTPAGTARAAAYPTFFSETDLAAVYTTPTRRTRATAQPLADAKRLPLVEYASDADVGAFAKTLLATHAGETVFVVGHSNTVPAIANALLGEERYGNIDHEDYEQVIQVIKRGEAPGEGRVFRLSFPHGTR